MLHAWATDKDDPTEDPVFGRVGKQKIENTGMLTRERMETFDGEVLDKTLDFLERVGKGDKPFFCWHNTTAIHIWSHAPKKYVQDLIRERADKVMKMLRDDDCYIYVCGLKMMEQGVLDAFRDVCQTQGTDWEALKSDLLAKNRLHIETY